MDSIALQDKISRGMGAAARKLGAPFSVYRPKTAAEPLCSRNRIIKLFASFNPEDGRYTSAPGFGHPIWWGVFDSAYTEPGDYLVGDTGTYFVCAQRPLLPVQCVLTNRIVGLIRAAAPAPGGYSGLSAASASPVISGYPASLLEAAVRENDVGVRAQRFGGWVLLLPPRLLEAPQVGDVVRDDTGMTYAVGAAEQTVLGWRLLARQVAA